MGQLGLSIIARVLPTKDSAYTQVDIFNSPSQCFTRYVASLLCNVLYFIYGPYMLVIFGYISQLNKADLSKIPVKVFLYFTRTSIAFVHMILLYYLFSMLALGLTNVKFHLCKTFLDSSILPDDANLDIQGYNLVWANYPANT